MSSTISSFSLSTILRQTVMTAQTNLASAEQEISTGRYADVGLQLGGQTGQAVSLRSEESLLQTIVNSNTSVTTSLSSSQNVLTNLQSTANNFLQSLIQGNNNASSATQLQATATTNLQSLLSELNTSVNGQHIFAGINTSVAPMTDNSSAVSTAFNTYLSGIGATSATITPSQMQTFLSSSQFTSLFQSGAGGSWSNWSSASDAPIVSQISPNQTVTTSVSANQSAFQQLTQAYAMVADLGTSNLSSDTYNTLLNQATSVIQGAVSGLTGLQAGLGTAQSSITNANNYMSTQLSSLSTQIGALENVDTYSVSTQATQLQTQIETAYTLTAQLQQLSLTKYL